jgi:DNA-binding beta-propeller fold protein YncE
VCISAVLGDALHRVAVLGGREGMARSLGSVYGGAVARFLGSGCRGIKSHAIATPGVESWCNGVAVSRDGRTLLVSDYGGGSHAIHEFSTENGSRRRVVGGRGEGALQFHGPCQLWIASDDFVFVADHDNRRVQVLTPQLDFHCFVGAGALRGAAGVCANDDVVVVSEWGVHRIAVFARGDGALLCRFGSYGSGDGELSHPDGVCFTCEDRHVAVADNYNRRVSVFSVEGEFVRSVTLRRAAEAVRRAVHRVRRARRR